MQSSFQIEDSKSEDEP